MRGTVAKKGNRWYAVVFDGVDPVTGKVRRRWVAAGTRRGDAEKLVTELVKRKHDGEPVVAERLTRRVPHGPVAADPGQPAPGLDV